MEAVKQFLVAHWPWIVVGAVLIVEDLIARSSLRSNSTIQLISSWLRMIPVLGRAFAVLAPKRDEHGPPTGGAALVLVVGALALSACGLSHAGRAHVALATTSELAAAADRAVTAYDEQVQAAAVAEAEASGSTAAARATLSEWRGRRAQARAALQAAHAGLLSWLVALQAYDAGSAKAVDWSAMFSSLTKIAAELLSSLRGLGVPNLPSLPEVR